MILKGSQRAGGADLAAHLMNGFDNETVTLAETRGTVATDLFGALTEIEAAAAGTRCKEPFYSLSINPPFALDRAAYFAAIARIEQRLGLEAQARAVVFHQKEGREHCHVVWSRITQDGDRLKAIHMSHDRSRLMDLSCAFFHELGVPLPEGLAAWEAKQPDRHLRPADYSRAEKEQSAATGITVAERRKAITEAYFGADTPEAFVAALAAAGYTLAIGDRRALVVLDESAQVFSLARQIEGATTRDVKEKLARLTGVPDVQKAKAVLATRAQERQARARETAQAFIDEHRRQIAAKRREASILSFIALVRLSRRHAEERLALKAKHKAEADALEAGRSSRLRRILAHVPVVSAILHYFQTQTNLAFADRQRAEREALAQRQHRQLLRRDLAETLHEKVARKEERALGQKAMVMAVRRAELERRRAKAEGRPYDVRGVDMVNPDSLRVTDWYRMQKANAADITGKGSAKARNHSGTKPSETTEDRYAEVKAMRRKVHAMRQNGFDITQPHATNFGAVDTKAATIFASLHRDPAVRSQTDDQGRKTPRDPSKEGPKAPTHES